MNKILTEYYNSQDAHNTALKQLDDATERIIKVLCKIFKKNRSKIWWAYDYYEDADGPMPMPRKVNNDTFPIYIDTDMGTDAWSYSNIIPIKFFDMSDAEIEEYIQKEIADDNARAQALILKEQKRAEEKRLKNKTLKESAMQKLTPDERKALGLK